MTDPTFKFTVTLYNKYEDRSTGRTVTSWKRTVLKNCFFGTETARSLNGNILSLADSFVCRIPQSPNYTQDYRGERNSFTLRPGDVIVKGAAEDEIKDEQGHRIEDLLRKYKDISFTVKAVSDNTILPYAPHYRASGV